MRLQKTTHYLDPSGPEHTDTVVTFSLEDALSSANALRNLHVLGILLTTDVTGPGGAWEVSLGIPGTGVITWRLVE